MTKVRPGLEVFLEQRMDLVRGLRVGLVTNHSAVTREFTHAVDALMNAGVRLTAVFGPEHGVRGDTADGQEIPSSVDIRTGIPVYSLYGQIKKPTPEMLSNIDVLLYDIQDVGCRFYTYTYTMSYSMQSCGQNGKRFVVLDRPNPVSGKTVEGNILDTEYSSFVGLHPIPIRHGMTAGEMATLLNAELCFNADLEIVECQGWKRSMWFDETNLPWIVPSPNMPTLDAALLYGGLCMIEGTNVSEGRGTTKPFEMVGAPWTDGYVIAEQLNSLNLPGVYFRPVFFTPCTSKHQQQKCSGIQVHVLDRDVVKAVDVGLHVIKTFHDLYPEDFQFRPPGTSGKHFFDLLAGTNEIRIAIEEGVSVDDIVETWRKELQDFIRVRQKYLIYS